ncbi:hypothetical protein QY96_03246 [Bacillus thermotolerans]|nr:hypothetical protein QY96_03246 [Bacillus thermotolerans]
MKGHGSITRPTEFGKNHNIETAVCKPIIIGFQTAFYVGKRLFS